MLENSVLVAALFSSAEIESASTAHPNQMKFSGTLVRLDEPSTKAPNGSRGHRILIPKALAEKTYKTLVGMGVNYSSDLEKHQPTRKVGVIKKAWIDGNAIKVSGIIWKKDFPDAEKDLKKANLGMSFEASDIDVEDQNADIWRLSNLCFTGAAILYKASAAYYKTEALAASASMTAKLITTNNGGVKMAQGTEKNKKKLSASASSISVESLVAAMTLANKPILEALNKNTAATTALQTSIEASQADSVSTKISKALIAGEDEEEDIEAAKDIEAEEDDEDEMDGKGKKKVVKAAKKKVKEPEDDDDEEDEDDDEMDSSADDEEELEDLDDEENSDTTPGHLNKKVPSMKKGNKTTVSTKGDKHKNVSASALSRISAQVDELIADNKADKKRIKQLEKKLSDQAVQLEAAGERTERRSVGSLQLNNLLSKNGVDTSTMSASGEKISVDEMDAMCEKSGLSVVQRTAMKTEAARIGLMDEGHVKRVN